jgi:hypothetical protein
VPSAFAPTVNAWTIDAIRRAEIFGVSYGRWTWPPFLRGVQLWGDLWDIFILDSGSTEKFPVRLICLDV